MTLKRITVEDYLNLFPNRPQAFIFEAGIYVKITKMYHNGNNISVRYENGIDEWYFDLDDEIYVSDDIQFPVITPPAKQIKYALTINYSFYGHHKMQVCGIYDSIELAKDAVKKAIPVFWAWGKSDSMGGFIKSDSNGMGLWLEWEIWDVPYNEPIRPLSEYLIQHIDVLDFDQYMIDNKKYFDYLVEWQAKHGM